MKKCNVFKKSLLLSVGLVLALTASGQSDRKDLESQRKALEKQIKSTNEVLQKTQKSKTKSMTVLKELTAQINQRQQLLSSINAELSRVKDEASMQEKKKKETSETITQMESRLTHALRTSYVRHQLQPNWIYLLSAQSIGQALTRWVYLRQYKTYMSKQLELLAEKKRQHHEMLIQLEENKKLKTQLYNEEEKHKREILQEQKSQEELLKNLSKEEKKLKNQLASTEAKKKKLDAEIARLIKAETAKVTSSGLSAAPETKALNDQFSANKGKLPWPVSKGKISGRYGEHPHPVLKGISVQNNGIDIEAESKAAVKSLFNGTVASITRIPGYDYMVMIRHGLYFTVYSKVVSVSVKKGDNVKTGEVIGHLGTEEPELHLEIWKDKTKMNPETWLAKK